MGANRAVQRWYPLVDQCMEPCPIERNNAIATLPTATAWSYTYFYSYKPGGDRGKCVAWYAMMIFLRGLRLIAGCYMYVVESRLWTQMFYCCSYCDYPISTTAQSYQQYTRSVSVSNVYGVANRVTLGLKMYAVERDSPKRACRVHITRKFNTSK